ncbi:hypothetical protein SERLADRAFT_437231 [Serpula lacrymans var. lacrymans S7.9]|uniref:Uncharacterized protein n=1 Tax=Serpula lacrymans var. lacrymans (strain S7.9) TaxID=578457 RepID=F8NT22_SERL9|nr:uncharacterized protein SERLADRAFT_437231 [Serpula lacrymans var. lacrymans S7.9]EGO25495.1 hypothetical protein SERLADRAFT_437231 [Serpula lacrymans var. lacrymans S7.9]
MAIHLVMFTPDVGPTPSSLWSPSLFDATFGSSSNTVLSLWSKPPKPDHRHRTQFGHSVFVALANLRKILDEHRRMVACELPEINEHALDCSNQDLCSADWWQAWWNGMGRFLLDGRYPMPYKEAAQRFQRNPFEQLIEDTAERLEKELIIEPLSSENEFMSTDE